MVADKTIKKGACKKKVLFVCVHNSARSQMAEAILNDMATDRFEAHSAGLEPGTLNPIAVEAMKAAGLDISRNKTKSVQQFIDAGQIFDYVITVCDQAGAERCPVFPGQGKRLHMDFEDPSTFQGSHQERLEKTVMVRDLIKARIQHWVREQENDCH